MLQFEDPKIERQMIELLTMGDRQLLAVWTNVGQALCANAIEDFRRHFAKVLESLPNARPSERMPNLSNWRWAGATLISAAAIHTHVVVCMIIVEARETLRSHVPPKAK